MALAACGREEGLETAPGPSRAAAQANEGVGLLDREEVEEHLQELLDVELPDVDLLDAELPDVELLDVELELLDGPLGGAEEWDAGASCRNSPCY